MSLIIAFGLVFLGNRSDPAHSNQGLHPTESGILVQRFVINSAADFGQQPRIANRATDLLIQLSGEAGAPARSAVGMPALRNGACIEIEMITEVED